MGKRDILLALMAALLVSVFLSPFASNFPDGLERVAEDKHFIDKVEDNPIPSKFADYTFPFLKHEKFQTAWAGFFGTAVVFLVGLGCAKLLAGSKSRKYHNFG